MSPADLDRVVQIESAIYEYPWTRGNFRDSMQAGYSCWAMVEQGALIGYAIVMFALDEAHLLNISIDGSRQREGLGSQLLEHILRVACRGGAKHLLLEVRPSNLAAQALYRRYGFERIGTRRGYYPARDGREDALVLRRPVGQGR